MFAIPDAYASSTSGSFDHVVINMRNTGGRAEIHGVQKHATSIIINHDRVAGDLGKGFGPI